MRIRSSLALPIVGLLSGLAVIAVLSAYLVNTQAMQSVLQARETDKAQNISFVVEAILDEEIKKLSATSHVLQNNRELTESLDRYLKTGREARHLTALMDTLYPELKVDIFELTDRAE